MDRDYSLTIMVMSGPDDGRLVELQADRDGFFNTEGQWVLDIGRRDDCDMALVYDTLVSRHHAQLRVEPDGTLWLADMGSMNGTFIDHQRLERPTQLAPGQMFRLGRTWLRVQTLTSGHSTP